MVCSLTTGHWSGAFQFKVSVSEVTSLVRGVGGDDNRQVTRGAGEAGGKVKIIFLFVVIIYQDVGVIRIKLPKRINLRRTAIAEILECNFLDRE